MNADSLAPLRTYLGRCIDNRIFPGCALGIIRHGERRLVTAGRLTYDASSPPVTGETLYDVASITKAIPVSCLALKFVEEGALSLSARLIDFVPEFSGSHREEILLRHLLTHTLDFDFTLSSKKDLRPAGILASIFSARLRTRPGATFSYANATSILLGLLVERVTGRRLDRVAGERFFEPLGMRNTTFFPEALHDSVIAPSEDDPWRGRVIRGEVHDESAWALRPVMVAGSAGLFSTAADLLRFIAVLLDGNRHAGMPLFKKETIALMHVNALPQGAGCSTGMGWELNQPGFMGKSCTASTFGKTGFTGCAIIVDPAREAGVVLLTNHTFPRRRADRTLINTVRSALADMLL